jgi:hypothetical protein
MAAAVLLMIRMVNVKVQIINAIVRLERETIVQVV